MEFSTHQKYKKEFISSVVKISIKSITCVTTLATELLPVVLESRVSEKVVVL